MQLQNAPACSPRTWVPVGLLVSLCLVLTTLPASAQRISSPSHPGLAQGATLGLNQSHMNTPVQVVDGTASLVGPYDPTGKLRLALGLIPPHLAEEEQFLRELQDKTSPNFHKYLTPEQWNARYAPSAEDEQAVVDWATQQGLTITARYPNRLMVNVEGTVGLIEKAFRISINHYQVKGATEFSNDKDPVIPANLATILGSVDGLNSIQRMRPANSALKGGARGPDYSPGPLRQDGPSAHGDALQKLDSSKASTTGKQGSGQITNGFNALQAQGHCCNPAHLSGGSPVEASIGLATDGDFADSDIQGFQAQYPYLAYYYHRVWVGGTPGGGDDETTLDTEWSIATSNSRGSYLDTAQVWTYEAAKGFGDFGTLYQQMLTDNHVRVVNISYGLSENYFSAALMNSWHATFNQMLGQGWTINAASGDSGASADCQSFLSVLYPESDPDVTSVGGTQLGLYSDGSFDYEVAWTGDTFSGACSENDGGTGGGCSSYWAAPGYQQSPFQSGPYCGTGSRSVPDIALNASAHSAQNYYFGGSLSGVAGTSIATPMMSGFVAQANAYLLAIGLGGAPLGEIDYKIYWLGTHTGNSYEAHYPFYDTTSGCNYNDNTIYWGLGYYCAGTGYDLTTGWGSFNALQLAWGFNTYDLGDFGAPVITFSGPSVSTTSDTWYNTDQTVSWTVADTGGGYTPTGVAGFSQAWDSAFYDPTSEATAGSGNSFYSGPQFPNATSGYLDLASAGQGCHYATVDAWDNSGITSGNQYYYWICYDSIAPTIAISNSPVPNAYGWNRKAVTLTLTSTDPGSGASGIKATYYAFDTGACYPGNLAACKVYTGPFVFSNTGVHYIYYFTEDVAGNFSSEPYEYVDIDETAPVTSSSLAGTLHGTQYDSAVTVTLSATDDLSGVQATYYQLDGGTNTVYTAPLVVTGLGNHTVTYYSVDYAGNTETKKSVSFSIVGFTTTTVTSSANPVVYGKGFRFFATVTSSPSGTPTGTVTFTWSGGTLGTATLIGNVATLAVGGNVLPPGHIICDATYNGTTNFLKSSSSGFNQTITENTTGVLTSSASPSAFGLPVTFTASFTAAVSGTVTGHVQFMDGAAVLATVLLNNGSATFTTTKLGVGSQTLKAYYEGNGEDLPSYTPLITQVVTQGATTTALASSLNPSTVGTAVTLTATVAPTTAGNPIATGSVTFKDGATVLGTVTLGGGTAKLTTTFSTSGTHSLTASYAGSSNYLTSSGNLSQVVH